MTTESTQQQSVPSGATNRVRDLAIAVRESVQKVIVGKSGAIDLALVALLCRGHVLVEDVPGTGKTTMAKALAASLRCQFRRIQFTPDLVPADVLGINFYNTKAGEFEFRAGPIFTQLLLADEINRATPRTQSALLEAMQERQASIDGVTSPLPDPFMVIATLNPVEMEGTFPLPEAQLDRFILRVALGYPSHDEESAMLERFQGSGDPAALEPVAGPEEIAAAQKATDGVLVDETVRGYILSIIEATRSNRQLRLGASPRASLALQHAAQARAAMDGRDYVLPDDVKALASAVLGHRLVAESSSILRGNGPSEVIAEIIAATPVPIER
ncbi:MAG: MoxR family ATPase [Dehalococcoidia bacterium]